MLIKREQVIKILMKKRGWNSPNCVNLSDNFLPYIDIEEVKSILQNAGGHEDRKKIYSIGSSSVLAINTFYPWVKYLFNLEIELESGILSGFKSLEIEKGLLIGLPDYRTKAYLDVWLQNSNAVCGIECKFLELLGKKEPIFSDQYDILVKSSKFNDSPWVELMRSLKPSKHFYYLDVAQLIKHYYGLMNWTGNEDKHLLYLYWHPSDSNWLNYEPYKTHQAELKLLHSILEKSKDVAFHSMSYQELWAKWTLLNNQEVNEHIDSLRVNYDVSLDYLLQKN